MIKLSLLFCIIALLLVSSATIFTTLFINAEDQEQDKITIENSEATGGPISSEERTLSNIRACQALSSTSSNEVICAATTAPDLRMLKATVYPWTLVSSSADTFSSTCVERIFVNEANSICGCYDISGTLNILSTSNLAPATPISQKSLASSSIGFPTVSGNYWFRSSVVNLIACDLSDLAKDCTTLAVDQETSTQTYGIVANSDGSRIYSTRYQGTGLFDSR